MPLNQNASLKFHRNPDRCVWACTQACISSSEHSQLGSRCVVSSAEGSVVWWMEVGSVVQRAGLGAGSAPSLNITGPQPQCPSCGNDQGPH